MANHKIIWTEDMDDTLIVLRHRGVSMRDCIPRIGVSYRPLQTRCQELGLNGRHGGDRSTRVVLEKKIREMLAQDPPVSYKKIAHDLGTTKGIVAGIAHRMKKERS